VRRKPPEEVGALELLSFQLLEVRVSCTCRFAEPERQDLEKALTSLLEGVTLPRGDPS
jgi:hypothetical protein